MSPIVLIGAGALLVFAGVGIGYLLGNAGRKKESAKAGELEAELDDYRRQASEHFDKTAAHFQAIGQEYRRLYEHMASGEAALCEAGQPIAFQPLAMVTSSAEPVVDEPEPPRDYELSATEAVDNELPETVAAEPAEIGDSLREPTDTDLAQTEAAEEILTEHELASEAREAEKTLH